VIRYCFLFIAFQFFLLNLCRGQVNPDSVTGQDTVVKAAVEPRDSPRDTDAGPDQPPVQPPAQVTIPPVPVENPMADSFSRKPEVKDTGWALNDREPIWWQVLRRHPYFGFNAIAERREGVARDKQDKDLLFYVLVGLLLVFAFLRHAFAKYFSDLYRLFFRTTLKYRQIREQLMQSPLPSMLLNGFFVVCAGFYVAFLLQHYGWIGQDEFWLHFLYASLGLSVIYLLKFLALKVVGWVFNMQDATDSYIFIVYAINKLIGVVLLPVVVMLAFVSEPLYTFALVLSWFGIGVLILYRYILSYAAVRNQVKLNPFQFLLYLLAFEFAPLLLIYKLLILYFN